MSVHILNVMEYIRRRDGEYLLLFKVVFAIFSLSKIVHDSSSFFCRRKTRFIASVFAPHINTAYVAIAWKLASYTILTAW